MTGPAGGELGPAIGTTDRGRLCRAGSPGRIVRVLDPKRCDEQFKDGLRALGQLQRPNLVRIAAAGYAGDDFRIEYALDKPWQTLAERLAGCAHWADRLAVLDRVCDVLPRWQESPVHPLGLNPHSIVLTEHGGTELAWLLPCPPVAVPTPRALAELDTAALAALAPERVRGMVSDERAQDMYALGTLVAQALAGPASGPRRVPPDADPVTAQARGALLVATPERSQLAPPLRDLPAVGQLFEAVRRCRHTVPDARPRRLAELRSALRAAADRVALAELIEREHPAQALNLLTGLDRYEPEHRARGLRLAARLHAGAGDLPAAVDLLDRAVGADPGNLELRQDRCDARWQLFNAPQQAGDDAALLRELAWLQEADHGGAEPYLRAAAVYRRRGDPYAVGQQLYAAAQADGSDLSILYDYASCLAELEGNTAAVRAVAAQRIAVMVQIGQLSEKEGARWRAEFDALVS